jgi:hypothetical protein
MTRLRSRRDFVRVTAVNYVAHGWGVLPGAVWQDDRYILGHSSTVVAGLEPVLPSARTLRDAREGVVVVVDHVLRGAGTSR